MEKSLIPCGKHCRALFFIYYSPEKDLGSFSSFLSVFKITEICALEKKFANRSFGSKNYLSNK